VSVKNSVVIVGVAITFLMNLLPKNHTWS